MAGGMDLGGPASRSGKKPLDAPINLVPFIDLMAVTISFLIMTAVWTQIGALKVSQSGEGSDPGAKQRRSIELSVDRDTLAIRMDGKELRLPALTGNDKVVAALRGLASPDSAAVTLHAADDVAYEQVVRLVDDCAAAGLGDVTVAADG